MSTFGLLKSGFLAVSKEGGSLPAEAAYHAYVVLRDTPAGFAARPVKALSDLEGFVQIRSPADALLYVRLFSGEVTYYLLRDPEMYGMIEVVPVTYRPPDEGWVRMPQLPGEWWQSQKLSEPRAFESGPGQFTVVRTVYAGIDYKLDDGLYEVRERVGRQGEYKLESARFTGITELPVEMPMLSPR